MRKTTTTIKASTKAASTENIKLLATLLLAKLLLAGTSVGTRVAVGSNVDKGGRAATVKRDCCLSLPVRSRASTAVTVRSTVATVPGVVKSSNVQGIL